MNLKLLIIFVFAASLNACVSTPQSVALSQQTDSNLLEETILTPLTFFSQSAYQCGPAALATMLVHSQVAVSPEDLVPLVYVPARKGSFQVEIVAATRSFGRIAYPLAPNLQAVFDEVRAGHPVLVLQNLGLSWYPRWHFAVVKGFDLGRETIILNSGTFENYEMKLSTFERTWARSEYWGVLIFEPGIIPVTADAANYYLALAELEETHPESDTLSGYRSGLQSWPADKNLLMGYGNLLLLERHYSDAAQQFETLIANDPDYAPAWNNLAETQLRQGEIEQARNSAAHAVQLGGVFKEIYHATLLKIESSE